MADYYAEHLFDDTEDIAERKRSIKRDEWQRAYHLGKQFLKSGTHPRDGRPLYSIYGNPRPDYPPRPN